MGRCRSSFIAGVAIVTACLMMSCSSTPHLVGTWKEVGKTATLVFREDGSFEAVDNQGMAVSGTYLLQRDNRVQFTVDHPGSPPEIVTGTLSVAGEELTLTSGEGTEVETYARER